MASRRRSRKGRSSIQALTANRFLATVLPMPRTSHLRALVSLSILGGLLSTASSAGADGPPSAVAVVTLVEAPEEVLRDLRAAASRALQVQGLQLVPHAYLRTATRSCGQDRACLARAAAVQNANKVLVLSGAVEETSFRLTAELLSPAGEALDRAEKECGICALPDLYAAAEGLTSVLVARERPDYAAPSVPTPNAAPRSGPKAQPSADGATLGRAGPWLGGGLVLLGVAAGITAAVMSGQDGELTCRPEEPGCVIERRRAGAAPLLWGVAAAAGVVGGGVMIYATWPDREETNAFVVGASGRF